MPRIEEQQPGFQFGVFEINSRTRELRKHGVKLKLQEQPFQTLLVLLERPGESVSREEIQNRLWPVNTYVDFDNAINSAVRKLREALGDSLRTRASWKRWRDAVTGLSHRSRSLHGMHSQRRAAYIPGIKLRSSQAGRTTVNGSISLRTALAHSRSGKFPLPVLNRSKHPGMAVMWHSSHTTAKLDASLDHRGHTS